MMVQSIHNSERILTESEIHAFVARALENKALTNKRVLVIIPDGTRSAPIGLFYRLLNEILLPRVAALDFLIALGTHPPMDEHAMQRRLGLDGKEWALRDARVHIFMHEWWKPETFYSAGVIGADEIAALTNGWIAREVNVSLNRLILDYDQLLICGPVYPHEVVGFSGGNKYLFPGIAGQEIIDLTHWLGALLTSYTIIGTKETVVRAVIERAASLVTIPKLAFCLVVREGGLAGAYLGSPYEAWQRAADHSAQVHIHYLNQSYTRVVSLMPTRYDDIWTAAKGMYKVEPIVADGGEVIIYAPHITEVSYTYGALLDAIGYHVRDYFVKQWDQFQNYPWGVLAHSTHLRGLGEYDAVRQIESPRVRVTLATGIPRERCEKINLGYLDPNAPELQALIQNPTPDTLVVPDAGEILFRLKS
jgi:nickel-dependent lactate racemase